MGIPIPSLWDIFKQSMWSLAHLPLQIPQADSGDQKTSWVPRVGAGKNKVEGCPDDHCSHLGTEMHLCLCPRLGGISDVSEKAGISLEQALSSRLPSQLTLISICGPPYHLSVCPIFLTSLLRSPGVASATLGSYRANPKTKPLNLTLRNSSCS